MDQICPKCGAFNFKDEKVSDYYTICCQNGKINLPPIQEPCKIIKDLYTKNDTESLNFRENIRNYNNSTAFASMIAQLDPLMKKSGPYFFKIHGQVFHQLSQSLTPDESEDPAYSQLFMLDTKQATEQRMKHPANAKCLESVIIINNLFV